MNNKKLLPIILLVLLAVAAISIRRCNSARVSDRNVNKTSTSRSNQAGTNTTRSNDDREVKFDRNAQDLFFTKHARCRMKCRKISQQEVKDILANGTVNYNKSNLNDPEGPTYAVEGDTDDGQHVRIIFAPKQSHMTVVTVIDLGVEHECHCE